MISAIILKKTHFLTFLNHLDFWGKMWYDAYKKEVSYDNNIKLF